MGRKRLKKPQGKQKRHTSPTRQRMMDTQAQTVADLLKIKLREGGGIDIPSFVKEWTEKNNYRSLADAFEQILNEPRAYDLHYYAIAGMRTIGDRGWLLARHVKTLLEKTERQALRFGNEEFYESIGAVARYSDTVPPLLEFVSDRLLAKQDIPDWRYISFVAIAAIKQHHTEIPEHIKKELIEEAAKEIEENPERKQEIEEFVNYNLL
jgi:hypothetical protein